MDQNGHSTTEKYFELQSHLASISSSKTAPTNGNSHHKSKACNTSTSNLNAQLIVSSMTKSQTSPSQIGRVENGQMTGNGNHNWPTLEIVTKKMKKITKAVQDLFKATKESEFSS